MYSAGGVCWPELLNGLLLHLLNVSLFNLLHQFAAAKEVNFQLARDFPGYYEKLVVNHGGERDRSARGDEVRAPLKHQASVPKRENSQDDAGDEDCGAAIGEALEDNVQKKRQADYEYEGERNEKAVAVRGDTGPVWIAGDEEIKSEGGCKKRASDEGFAAPKKQETDDGKQNYGGPGEKAVIG